MPAASYFDVTETPNVVLVVSFAALNVFASVAVPSLKSSQLPRLSSVHDCLASSVESLTEFDRVEVVVAVQFAQGASVAFALPATLPARS